MRKFSYTKTLTAMVIFIGLSLPANAELIGTGNPSATASSSCNWLTDGVLTCLAAWWNEI